jgi:S-methylmethionine-dependent homocysteine/selenocysteine methylase
MTKITLLDGSIGQQLVRRSGDPATPLWSTQVMMDHPEMVEVVHRDYFAAGASIASTNTYAVHRNRLERVGLEHLQLDLIRVAVSQACAARAHHGTGRVAGTLGPVLASYRPDLAPSPDFAAPLFAEICRAMEQDVDLFLIETVSSLEEAEGALSGASASDKPVWIAFSVRDDDGEKLRSGEPLSEIGPLLNRFTPEAVLINCSPPEVIGNALAILADFGLPFGAYANGFTAISDGFLEAAPTVDALETRTDLTPEIYADFALQWARHGATILGGCCEVGPAHIAELARRLCADGYEIA